MSNYQVVESRKCSWGRYNSPHLQVDVLPHFHCSMWIQQLLGEENIGKQNMSNPRTDPTLQQLPSTTRIPNHDHGNRRMTNKLEVHHSWVSRCWGWECSVCKCSDAGICLAHRLLPLLPPSTQKLPELSASACSQHPLPVLAGKNEGHRCSCGDVSGGWP